MNIPTDSTTKSHGKSHGLAFGLVFFVVQLSADVAPAMADRSATLLVATNDSSEKSKAAADLVADGDGDQEEINAAVRALPPIGGTVLLAEGTYDIKKVPGRLGGVLIERGDIVLAGRGTATKLIQGPEQETNVIRIIGSGVGNITVRDLYVDANRDRNPKGEGDPNISHDRFEYCGIKAFCAKPGVGGEPCHDITIRNTTVLNARRLGIMLEGLNMKVINNHLGNAMSDSVEILTGPGEIRGNYFEITGRTHVAAGSDRGNSILMADNIVHVKETGDIDIGFRSWADSHGHVIADNVLIVDPGGKCAKAMDIRGFDTTVTGNNLRTHDPKKPLVVSITGSNAVLTGNVFQNVRIEVDDKTGANKPILVRNNLMDNAAIVHKTGNLVTEVVTQASDAKNSTNKE